MPVTLSRHEVALALLHAAHSLDHRRRPMAMMTRNSDVLTQEATGLAAATARAAWDTHTAIVNLVQSASRQGVALNNREVYTTQPPSAACLGIAKLMRTKAIYFFDGPDLYQIDLTTGVNVNLAPMQRVGEPQGNDRLRGLPDDLSTDALRGAGTPEERGNQAAAWYWRLDRHWENFKPYQKTNLKPSFDSLPTWTGVDRVPMPGVPIVGRGGMMRTNYADELFMMLAYTLAARSWGPQRRVVGGHNIAAVLASYDGTIHAWGINYLSLDATRHAETNLIQALQGPIPANATLYTTLQSCFMCAGLFVHAGGERCVYGQKDPTMDGKTALSQNETQASDRFTGSVRVGPAGPRVDTSQSMGQHLETQRTTMLAGGNDAMRLVPNFLNTTQAGQTYSYGQERLANLARAATNQAERNAWTNILQLLRTRGLALPANRMLGDESTPPK